MSKTKQKLVRLNSPQAAQEMQDEIFRKMSPADKKIKLAADLWRLAKAIDGDKIDFRNGTVKK